MKHGTGIEWTHIPGYKGETWNPWGGCSKKSKGCDNCWALRQANRFKNHHKKYMGTVRDGNWTGKLNLAEWKEFSAPARWQDPRAAFVCSMSDFLHPGADEWRRDAWNIIATCRRHVFQILTKRPERFRLCLPYAYQQNLDLYRHVQLGITAEDQSNLVKRWRHLSMVPSPVWFFSLEPLLGPIDFEKAAVEAFGRNLAGKNRWRRYVQWVIVGGESGPGARPMEAEWVQSIRDQCQAAEVPFFFKQWGDGGIHVRYCSEKKMLGPLLDGRIHKEFPL